MGCDIHIITEIKKDGKWEFVPEIPKSLNKRNYTTFAVLAGVRDSFNSNIFPVRGLPSDMSKKKFCFESERPYMEKRYNEDSTTCLVIEERRNPLAKTDEAGSVNSAPISFGERIWLTV